MDRRCVRRVAGICVILGLFIGATGRVLEQSKKGKETGGSFLSKELPLKIIATTPARLIGSEEGTLLLGDQQALTAVFSRSVVALGEGFGSGLPDDKVPFTLDPPVPGQSRWVSSHIYRFDPEDGWPLDSQTTLRWNSKLVTHDGIPLGATEETEVVLFTASLAISILDISSTFAQNLTGGLWDASIGTEDDNLPEAPPGGNFRLRFSHPVSISVLKESLKVFDEPAEKQVAQVEVDFCDNTPQSELDNGESTCANVTVVDDLPVNSKLLLTLEKGVKYSKKAGALRATATAPFGSLRKFILPFLEDAVNVRSQILDMWLPHGLPNSEDTAKIQSIMRLSNPLTGGQVPFSLKQETNGILRLTASLEPGKSYRLNVIGSSTVKDGYDQPLGRSSIEFSAAQNEAQAKGLQISSSKRLAIFEAGQEWGKKVVMMTKGAKLQEDTFCDTNSRQLDIWSLQSDSDTLAALDITKTSTSQSSLKEVLKKPDASLVLKITDPVSQIHELDVEKLMKKSGIIAQQFCSNSRFKAQVTVESDLQVMFLSSRAAMSAPATGTAWVTSMATGKPVQGANVNIYVRRSGKVDGNRVLVGKGETDNLGRAVVKLGNDDSQLDAVVEFKGKFTFLPRISLIEAASSRVLTALVLDRKLVVPEQTLNIKGYVMRQEGAGVDPVLLQNARLVITPTFNRSRAVLASSGSLRQNLATDTFPVSVNDKFGSFEATIPVPLDAPLTEYKVRFEAVTSKGGPILGAKESFVVGNPRPPTVELLIDGPKWATPNGIVEIGVTAVSLLGSAVGGAEVNLKWSINDPVREFRLFDEDDSEGATVVTTDDEGIGSAAIDLGSLSKTPSPGSTLSVMAQWIGPTRELIEEDLEIKLELANVMIDIELSVYAVLPERAFAVRANVTDLEGGVLDNVTEITIMFKKLRKAKESEANSRLSRLGSEPIDGLVVEECSTIAGRFDYECRFSMPVLGEYAVEVCHKAGPSSICRREFIGQTLDHFKDNPLDEFLSIGISPLSKGPYQIGDTASFALENPYQNAYALMVWGSELGLKQKVIELENTSLNELSIPVDKICAANCELTILVSVPRQEDNSIDIPDDLNVHPLFDPALPHTKAFYEDIIVLQDREVSMSITFPELGKGEFVLPGESTPIKVSVEAESAEVTIIAVDKAILELAPHKLRDLAADFMLDLAMKFSASSTADYLVTPKAISTLIDNFVDRFGVNPWADLVTDLKPSFSNREVALSKEEYLDFIAEFITVHPVLTDAVFGATARSTPGLAGRSAGGIAVAKITPGANDDDDLERDSSGSSELVRFQKDFISTPTFQTKVAKSGVVSVDFEAPGNLGTFIVRAYAATGDGRFGSQEGELIVRRPLSLTPSAPRFVRVGDEFEAGVIVTVPETKSSQPITVTISTNESVDVVGPASLKIRVGNDGQEEVRFKLKAKLIGNATLKFAAGSKDSLVIELPVEEPQERVTLGSTFTVSGEFKEAIKFPSAVPGSGTIDIQAGFGQLPRIFAIIQQLYAENMNECPMQADFALAAAAIPIITGSYNLQEIDRNLIVPDSIILIDQMEPQFLRSTFALGVGNLTNVNKGLLLSLPCPENRVDDSNIDSTIEQNAKGLWLFEELSQDISDSNLEVVNNATELFESASTIWRKAVANSLIQQAVKSREELNTPLNTATVALARASLGADWMLPSGTPKQVQADLSMERLSDDFETMSLESQAYYVLSRLRAGEKSHPDVQKAINSWTGRIRVGGQTGYISKEEGSSQAASNIGNGLALLAIAKANAGSTLASKLVGYVAAPPVGDYNFRVFSNFDKVVAMLALREYDEATESTLPNISLNVDIGKKSLLNFVFNDALRSFASSSTPWDDLGTPLRPIQTTARGLGEITMTASLSFVPATPLKFPTFRGLFVQRTVQLLGADSLNGEGPSLAVMPVGSIVVISVQVTTPDRLGPTTIRVLLPAGLEPIDLSTNSLGGVCPIPFFEAFGPRISFSCPTQEVSSTTVTFQHNSLFAGTHLVSFRAVAATAGIFSFPPTRAFASQEPEIMGLSAASTLEICAGNACEASAEETEPNAQDCPLNCNGNGACDLTSGSCVCLQGFGGTDCNIFS